MRANSDLESLSFHEAKMKVYEELMSCLSNGSSSSSCDDSQ